MKGNIKIVRFEDRALFTAEDLVMLDADGVPDGDILKHDVAKAFYSKHGRLRFPAVVRRGNSLSMEYIQNCEGIWIFEDVVLDPHGTISAAVNLLRRVCKRKKIGATRRGVPIVSLVVDRLDELDLFIIAQWEKWNLEGVLWDERNFLAQSCEFSLGKMQRKAFEQRCTRKLGLVYVVK